MRTVLFILFLFISLAGTSQISYPHYEKDSLGNATIVITEEQAQALDNSTDLLALFEKLNVQIGSMDEICLKVIKEKDEVISSQTVQINNLKSKVETKEEIISSMSVEISHLNSNVRDLKRIVRNKEKEISLHLQKLNEAKWKWGTGAGVIGAVAGLVVGALVTR